MSMIQTKSFELAVSSQGSPDAAKVALLLPGRLNSKDYADMQTAVHYFASRGYFALTFDPPGTWESPGGIELYTMTNYLRAVDEVIEHYGNKSTVLMGHSRGGTVAMVAGMKNVYVTHIIAAMSGTGGTTFDMPEKRGEVRLSYRDMPPGTEETKEQKRFDLPYNYFEDAAHYDAQEGLKHCTKPKLFFLGLRDAILSPESMRAFYRVAAEAKIIHELDCEHDYRYYPEMIEEVHAVIGEFLDTYP